MFPAKLLVLLQDHLQIEQRDVLTGNTLTLRAGHARTGDRCHVEDENVNRNPYFVVLLADIRVPITWSNVEH